MQELDRSDLEDLIRGCSVLGTGGGGSPTAGMAALHRVLDRGKKIRMVSLDDVPNGATVATPYMVGSVSPDEQTSSGESDGWETLGLKALDGLEEHLGQQCFAVLPTEIGGYNTAVALCIAAERKVPVVDADPAGRSVPGVEHTSFAIYDVPITPMSLATRMGDVLIVRAVADDFRAEAIARALAVVSGNVIAVADHPVDGQTLKRSVIPGTLSQALAIGRAIRLALTGGRDPVDKVLRAGEGYLLFSGVVSESNWHLEGGFTFGEIVIQGKGRFAGHSYQIQYKNEHYASWLDEAIDVTVPDLICLLCSRTGEAITNPNCRKGADVAVVGFSAPDVWRSPKGLRLLGPRAFGLDVEYRPVSEGNHGRARGYSPECR